jgi:hypothetical protein
VAAFYFLAGLLAIAAVVAVYLLESVPYEPQPKLQKSSPAA